MGLRGNVILTPQTPAPEDNASLRRADMFSMFKSMLLDLVLQMETVTEGSPLPRKLFNDVFNADTPYTTLASTAHPANNLNEDTHYFLDPAFWYLIEIVDDVFGTLEYTTLAMRMYATGQIGDGVVPSDTAHVIVPEGESTKGPKSESGFHPVSMAVVLVLYLTAFLMYS